MTFALRKEDPLGAEWIRRHPAEWKRPVPIEEPSRPEVLPIRLKRKSSSELQRAIEASRYVYALKDDWDGAGSPGYSHETWLRAINFLKLHASASGKEEDELLAPTIGPGPDGAIDLYWKTETFELLITVPAANDEPAQFYGDDYGKQTIKGTLSTSIVTHGLLEWITKN